MRLAVMLYLSLLILPNIAHAADLERQEHDIVTATGRAVIAAGDNNYRAAVAECDS
jgi:predicted fused transcriptional regulator/phosphomethylpyrimidine kinase